MGGHSQDQVESEGRAVALGLFPGQPGHAVPWPLLLLGVLKPVPFAPGGDSIFPQVGSG